MLAENTDCVANDECFADLVLVPAAQSYSVRVLAELMSGARLCVARLEPMWRYSADYAIATPTTPGDDGAPNPVLLVRTALDSASIADEMFHSALSHAFLVRRASGADEAASGMCGARTAEKASKEADPLDDDLVPIWVFEGVTDEDDLQVDRGKRIATMLRNLLASSVSPTQDTAWSLMTPHPHYGIFSSTHGAPDLVPTVARQRLLAKLRALPDVAPSLVATLDGCTSLAEAARRAGVSRAAAVDVYKVLEHDYGLRLASRDGGLVDVDGCVDPA
eukprot:7390636-Prymnesium_polylepis.1